MSSVKPELQSSKDDSVPQVSDEKRKIVIIGVDEAGRGPMAGDVVAGACAIFDDEACDSLKEEGLRDSKKMNEKQLEAVLALMHKLHPRVRFTTSFIDAETIDEINIEQAAHLGMTRAVWQLQENIEKTLGYRPQYDIRIDGNKIPAQLKQECKEKGDLIQFIIGGDDLDARISAAAVAAKTLRDSYMRDEHELFP